MTAASAGKAMGLPRWRFAEPQQLESPYASSPLLPTAKDYVSNPTAAAVANVPVFVLARATVGFGAATGDDPMQPSPRWKCWTPQRCYSC